MTVVNDIRNGCRLASAKKTWTDVAQHIGIARTAGHAAKTSEERHRNGDRRKWVQMTIGGSPYIRFALPEEQERIGKDLLLRKGAIKDAKKNDTSVNFTCMRFTQDAVGQMAKTRIINTKLLQPVWPSHHHWLGVGNAVQLLLLPRFRSYASPLRCDEWR